MTPNTRSADRPFIFFVGAATLVVAALPYVVGQLLTPPGYLFQGNTVLAPADPGVYYSYIEQARQGAVMMRDLFSSEPHAATLWQPVWLVLGWIANMFHLSTPAVFVLGRLLSVLVFVATVWWVAGWLWPERTPRRIATLLVLGASGLGGMFAGLAGMNFGLMLQLPPDLWVSEMVPMLSAWATPHFLLVTSGFIFVVAAVERSWQTRSWRLMWWAGAVSLLTLSIHPFHALTWIILWMVLTLWQWQRTGALPVGYCIRWVFVLLVSLPALLYYVVGLVADPIVQGRAIQNINLTPSWWKALIGLGGTGLLGVLGAIRMRREKNQQLVWLAAWAIVQFVVIFLPFNSQRRLMQAMIIPIALLAVPSVVMLWRHWAHKPIQRAVAMMGLSLVLVSSTVVAGAWVIHDYYQERQGRNHWEYFLSPEYQQLFTHLRQTVAIDEPVLASAWDSIMIAGFSGRTVVGGHPVETLRYDEKITMIKRFYQSEDAAEQAAIVSHYRACYILYGPREKAYGQGFQPENWPDLTVAWSGPTMTLYRSASCRSGG